MILSMKMETIWKIIFEVTFCSSQRVECHQDQVFELIISMGYFKECLLKQFSVYSVFTFN